MKKKLTWSALAKFISEESSDSERDAVQQWIDDSSAHRQLHDDMKKVVKDNHLNFPHFDVERGKKLLKSRMLKEKHSPKVKATKVMWMRWAAIFLLLTSLSVYFFTENIFPFEMETEVITKSGEKSTLRLPDGTFVMLNAGSRLSYGSDYGKESRKISLTGEAYFDVQKDKSRPFVIEAGEIWIRVLGTSFNVQANPLFDKYTVAVSEGHVEVEALGMKSHLIKNQKAVYDRSSRVLKEEHTDLLLELAWMDDEIIFRDTPLKEAAKTLELAYGISVKFENNNIEKCIVTGRFERTTLRKIIMSICYSNELKYEYKDGYVLLKGNGC